MSNLYQKTYRGYLIDHHSPDPPVVTLDKLDIDEHEDFFKEANINNLMVYCKDHWGVTYYPSQVGKIHPGISEDWLAKLKPVLKANNIEFMAYYCLEYDNYAPTVHPEWATLKADGEPLRCSYSKAQWHMPCYETGYREYALTQLQEIVDNYQPDSLFLDIFGKSLCYCPQCRQKFKDEYGYKLLEEKQKLREVNQDVVEFLDNCAKSMLEEIIDTVKSSDPEIKVTINFAALYKKEIRDMLDFQFTEPWAGNWLSAAYARDTAIGQYPQLGPGDVSEVYNYQPENIYKLAAARIAAQGCRVFMYSGSQHPDGTLEHEEARRIGQAYREVEKFEEYIFNREVIADIGIVQSDKSSRIKSDDAVAANAIARVKKGSKHREALLGAMKLSDYANYTWKVIPEQMLSEDIVDQFKVLILPDVYYVNKELQEVVEGFVTRGGLVITAGETGLYDETGKKLSDFTLNKLYGCQYIEDIDKYEINDWGGYIERKQNDIWQYTPDTYHPVNSIYYQVAVNEVDKDTITSLGNFVKPATEITEDKWVNWWSPPPADLTDNPALLVNSYGSGKTVYAAFDFFKMENEGFNYLKGLFKGLLEEYMESPVISLETDYPQSLQFVSYERPQQQEIIIHELSNLARKTGGEAPLIPGGTIVIDKSWKRPVMAEIVYPPKEELEIIEKENNYHIKLPEVSLHQVVRVKY